MPEQLSFDLPAKEALGREDFFVSTSNEMAVAVLSDWQNWPQNKMVLIGPQGGGKTHLAHVWAQEAQAEIKMASDLTAANVETLASKPLALEDLHDLKDGQEEALFHLHNLMQAQNNPFLLTSRVAPARLETKLPDLRSRLEATAVVGIEALDDALMAALLMKLFVDRQIAVKPTLFDYVLPRLDRSHSAAAAFVEAIDSEGLAQGRPVGRSLARDILNKLG